MSSTTSTSAIGHSTISRRPDQAGLAEEAVIKLEGDKANRHAQTASAGLGKVAKNKGESK